MHADFSRGLTFSQPSGSIVDHGQPGPEPERLGVFKGSSTDPPFGQFKYTDPVLDIRSMPLSGP